MRDGRWCRKVFGIGLGMISFVNVEIASATSYTLASDSYGFVRLTQVDAGGHPVPNGLVVQEDFATDGWVTYSAADHLVTFGVRSAEVGALHTPGVNNDFGDLTSVGAVGVIHNVYERTIGGDDVALGLTGYLDGNQLPANLVSLFSNVASSIQIDGPDQYRRVTFISDPWYLTPNESPEGLYDNATYERFLTTARYLDTNALASSMVFNITDGWLSLWLTSNAPISIPSLGGRYRVEYDLHLQTQPGGSAAVPEPASVILLGAGLAAVRARRKRARL